jgi:cytochrome c peroxidase
MKRLLMRRHVAAALGGLFAVSAAGHAGEATFLPNMLSFPNPTGYAATYSTTGTIPLDGPFFQSLGSNGRSCGSCHQPGDGWTVIPSHIRERFEASGGTDPIFRTNDGSNSPFADVSTVDARRNAYNMLLNKGLIRVGIGIPAGAEFELIAVDDPYGYASASELSLFRRPLPSTNLKFLSTVMLDGRETFKDPTSQDCIVGTTNCFASIHFDLADQSNTATTGHAQAANALTTDQREAIVAFEMTLFTAQVFDAEAGHLSARHARGGPEYLSSQTFYFGINDVVSGDYKTGAPFNPKAFDLYESWRASAEKSDADQGRNEARAAVARGETLFNSRPILIKGVKGLNDDLGIETLPGTCTTCHDTPSSGNHSIPAPLDIGLTDASRRTPDMPLYTLRNKQAPGEISQTTDPGRALITGKWRDIGRFKGPILRGLAARAPYFHNGFAKDLDAAVDFYNERFGLGLTDTEHDDLVAFLLTL